MNDQARAPIKQEDDEIDLRELLHTILSGKWRILFYTLLATIFAFIFAFGQTPVYKADALLQVEKEKKT